MSVITTPQFHPLQNASADRDAEQKLEAAVGDKEAGGGAADKTWRLEAANSRPLADKIVQKSYKIVRKP